jgi:hypothetical protein
LPTQAQIHQRRVDLAKALGSFGEPEVGLRSSFLKEVRPTLEREAALANMRARWAQDTAQALLQHDELAKQGEAFAVWPSNRCWPEQPAAWVKHSAWFAMWRAKAPRPCLPVTLEKKVKALQAQAPNLERSNSNSSLASWDALSEISWQDAADAEVTFESMLSKLSDEDLGKLKETIDQQLADAKQGLQDLLSSENNLAVVEEVKGIMADCQKDLAAAMPALESAVNALSCLSKADVCEVKAMKTPPSGVVLAAHALCLMFSVKAQKVSAPDGKGKVDDLWGPAKKELLSDPRLLERMVSYDKDNIPDAVIQKVMPLYNNPNFEPDTIKKASVAAMSICMWVRALVIYHQVAKTVAPKRAALAAAEKKLVTDEMLEAKHLTIQEMQRKMDLAEFEEAQRSGEAAVIALKNLRAQTVREQAKVDLAEAEPKLHALKKGMKEALDGMNVKDFQELKCLCKPPAGVDDAVGVVVCLIKGKSLQKMNWSIAQRVMSNAGSFLLQIKAFDAKATIPISTLRSIRATTRKEHFNVEAMTKKSRAAACLVNWALKTLEYNELYQKVLPLMEDGVQPQGPVDSAEVPFSNGEMQAAPGQSTTKAEVNESISSLGKSDLQELKSFSNPPENVKQVCVACALLLKNVECDWKGCQKMLGDPGHFLEEVQSLDIDEIPLTALRNCSPITQQPSFTFDNVKKSSAAAARLAAWVISIMKYHKYTDKGVGGFDDVKPKVIVNDKDAKVTAMGIAQALNKNVLPNCYLAKADIVELKSLSKPPSGVISVFRCVQILLGKEDDWAAAKRTLGDVNFMRTLLEYRREDATQDQLQQVQLLLESDAALRDDSVLKVSKAAYGLLRWVRAVVSTEVVGVSTCPAELELDGELRTAAPTPVTTPANTRGSTSNANTPSAITEQSGMVHLHLSEAAAAAKAFETPGDRQNTNETDKTCVIS